MSPLHPPPLLPLSFLVLVGCNYAKTETTGNLDLEWWTESTQDGALEVTVDVEGDIASFLLTAETWDMDLLLSVEEVWSPGGELVMSWDEWWESDEWIGEPFYPYYPSVFFNWPIREQDGPLEEGSWSVVVSSVDSDWAYEDTDLDISLQRRWDSDANDGTVHVWMVWARGVKRQPEVEEAVQDAVKYWRDIWDPYGLDLDVEWTTMRGIDPDLPAPGSDSWDLYNASYKSNGEQITIILGESVAGDAWTYGMSGGIPGGLVPTDRSAIAISWLAHAGNDASFTEEEVRIFGGSLAHEVGHYMGLPHPVEDGYQSWDALDDTPRCSDQDDCEDRLGTNLMFPYTICDWDTCSTQETLTDDQVAVALNYSGTL